ncbi:MAG: hypothetical protein Q8M31_21270 [Beijerinckiaceae bacterium]|nr:hypothetical protein [Beijerinckiaceae bacterium]
MNILAAIEDPNLFRLWFHRKGRDASSWAAWRAILAAIFALPMDEAQLATYRELTGRTAPPTKQARETWLVCGRRAGKSFILALVAVYLACFHDHRRYLQPGERATVLIIASDRRQARVIFRFVRGLLMNTPLLKAMLQRETADAFDLAGQVSIEISTASFRSTRGYTLVAALCDEIAFWQQEGSAAPDTEILNSLRPAMAMIPQAMLLAASSPFGRRGALFDAHKRHYGIDDDPTLVVHAPTRALNPLVRQSIIDEAMEADPIAARSEFYAEFRSDGDRLVTSEAIQACVAERTFERAPSPDHRHWAFVDPSGGSADAMTLAIAHMDAKGFAVLDAVREVRPPFSPEAVVQEFASLLRHYGVTTVTGDRYAGEWPREQFRKCGIKYAPSERTKSELYLTLLPLLNSGRVSLLDDKRLIAQLTGLQRRTARGGRDSIDHASGAHDDIANAVAGALALVARPKARVFYGMHAIIGAPIHWLEVTQEDKPRAWRRGSVVVSNVRVN